MTKLTASQVSAQRALMLGKQGGNCALCCTAIAPGEDVLDHDHTTGHVRAVLHRGCNSMLGVIENNRPRYMLKGARLFHMLSRVEAYLTADFTANPLHPTHRTDEEKRKLTNLRARKARAAKKAT